MNRLIIVLCFAGAYADYCKIKSSYKSADADGHTKLAESKNVKTVYEVRDICLPWCCEFPNCLGVIFESTRDGLKCYPYSCDEPDCRLQKTSKPQMIFVAKRLPDTTTAVPTTTPQLTTVPTSTPYPPTKPTPQAVNVPPIAGTRSYVAYALTVGLFLTLALGLH